MPAMHDKGGSGSTRVVAGYVVERLVGRGGMGEVYRAFDTRLERPVALKLLSPELVDDSAFRDRLLRESRLAAGLDHPNVVPVYDAGETGGSVYIAMRFVEGTDLRKLLDAEGPLSSERAIAIAAQVASALDSAHAGGLVHRDVKPSNVLVDRSEGREHCYLADFGLTQSVTNRPVTDGELAGTVDYIAPEQIRGDPVDGRADIYALGCVLYEMLTGDAPFRDASDVATLFAHLEEEPVPASERRPELPSELDAVLARAMAKDPADRHPTCGELVGEARSVLGLVDHGRSSARRLASLLAILATLAVGAAVVTLTQRGSGTGAPDPGASLVRIDASSGEVVDRVGVDSLPSHIVPSAGQLWYAAGGDLWRLDPRGGEPVKIESVGAVHDMAALDGVVYVARDGKTIFEGVVVPYLADGSRGDGVASIVCSLAADATTGLWASPCPNVQQIVVQPGRLSLGRAVPIPFPVPTTSGSSRWCLCDMAAGGGSLWVVGDALDRRLWRVAPAGRIEATIDLAVAPRSVALTDESAWVTGPLDDVVVQVDTRTNRVVREIPVGRGAAGIAAGEGSVWVAGQLDGVLSRVDPGTGQVVDSLEIDGRPTEVAVADGTVWVAVDER